MKYYTTLLFTLLMALLVNGQHQLADKPHLGPAITNLPAKPRVATDSRSQQVSFVIDYDAIDERHAMQNGGNMQRYIWEINSAYTSNDANTLRTAAVNFDSIMFVDGMDSLITYPVVSAQLNLDSFALSYYYTHHSVNPSQLILSVLRGSSFTTVGIGVNATITGEVLWADTTQLDTSMSFSNIAVIRRHPMLSLPRGEWFAIKIDVVGDTANKFSLVNSCRDDCNDQCAAELPAAGPHSYYYLNYTSNGNDVSGLGPHLLDCNQDGIAGAPGACENYFLQNHYIFPMITADIVLTPYFDNDTFAFCNGANTLRPHVVGAEGNVRYSWSPSTGLSSDTALNPVVQIPVIPIKYTLTVIDDADTATTSIWVSDNPALCQLTDTFAGRVYFDLNNNQQYDNGETLGNGVYVQGNSQYVRTDSLGYYRIVLPRSSGTYTLKVQNYYGAASFTLPLSGVYTGQMNGNHLDFDFAMFASPDSINLNISVVNPSTPARPGFQSQLKASVFNFSPFAATGDVKVVYDSLQSFVSASPTPDNVDVTNRTLTWNTSLDPIGVADYFVTLHTSPTIPLGTVLEHQAFIVATGNTTDVDTSDSHTTYVQTVVGAFDPNDKSVSPPGQGPDGRMLPGQNLQYTIRFQNTGTFYAENVAVRDTLDTDLDLSTFRMLSASHRYEYTFNGNVVTWNFNQIMLLDSHTNEPASHGYISYAIAMKDDVVDLSPINNTAYIYFDFNEAIITNTTLSTVDYNLNVGITEVGAGALVKVYPNPFKGETNFVLGSECKGASLKVYNLTGQLVDQKDNLTEGVYTYSTKKLASGMYNYLIVNNQGILAKGKLIME